MIYSFRYWLYVIVALALLVTLSGCTVAGMLLIPNPNNPDGPPLLHYTGTPGGAAAVGVEYVRSQREPAQAEETVVMDCTKFTGANAQEECVRMKRDELLLAHRGSQSEKNEPDTLARYLHADATMEAARLNFLGTIIGASISGGTSLISQAINNSTARKRDAQLYETFRTFAEEGGDSSYEFEQVVTGGDFSLNQIGRDGNIGGGTITQGSAQDGSALDTNDTLTQPQIDASGGDGDPAGSAAPITTNPTDVDSETSLF